MSTQILEQARLFLVQTLQGKPNRLENRYPWRRDWQFAVLHSLRVESYAVRIVAREKAGISEQEALLLRLAAILHDIGRLEKREGHAALGAQIAQSWLQELSNPALGIDDIERVAALIRDHSNKEVHDQDFSKAVLKDADTLDEIGIMSIFMSASWVEPQSPFFFYDLQQRLIDFEIPYCDRKILTLNTGGAREILEEKKAFLERCIAQLAEETQTEGHMEQMLLKLSKNGDDGPHAQK